jgi:hypothetical protein
MYSYYVIYRVILRHLLSVWVCLRVEQQRERRQLRALQGRGADAGSDSEEEDVSKDVGVFSRGCKQVTMTGGGGSEAAIQDAIMFK